MHTSVWFGAIILAASVQAKHGVHDHLEAIHRRHKHERDAVRQVEQTLVKRGTCAFPTNLGLVAVTPGQGNGGWAFAPDQACTVGRYCPYACPPGQVSMQWDPSVTKYVYPGSRSGGLLCNSDGTVSKPFPNRPYCQATTANVGVQNNCGGKNIAFCQTVLPGDEDMLIPTDVTMWSQLAVPDTSYWASTAAHYYINPPGVSSTQGCVWGSTANPYGNWAPYVAGANTDPQGLTYIKLGWNPIYLETTTPFRSQMPTWGVRIECPNGGCNGLPCSIDPSTNKVNEMVGSSSSGAGGGTFCVVTVNKGLKANFVVFESGTSDSSKGWSGTGNSSSSSSTTTSKRSSSTSTASGQRWSNQGGQFYGSNSESPDSGLTPTTSTSSADFDGPTGVPQFQLFNTSNSAGSTTTTHSSSSTSNPLVAQHTGTASSIGVSFGLLLFGLGIIFV